MARRGRPRDPDAKRRRTTTAGRAPDRDHGTPEQQLRRIEALGGRVKRIEAGRVLADVDPALAGSRLGVLLARGALDRHGYEAGERYQALAWAAWGRPFARGVDIARPRGEPVAADVEEARVTDADDRRRSGARRALARADARLAEDRPALRAVKAACQFDRPEADTQALCRGLAALAAWWGM
jgi:hypothetical protein